MSFAEYQQVAEDHCCLLILVCPVGSSLNPKNFNKIYERISRVHSIRIANPSRMIYLRYRKDYPTESNAWGDFQFHRRALGLISVGKCEEEGEVSASSRSDETGNLNSESEGGKSAMRKLYQQHEDLKEKYESTLLDSRLLMLSSISRQKEAKAAICKQTSAPIEVTSSNVQPSETNGSCSSSPVTQKSQIIIDPLNVNRLLHDSYDSSNEDDDTKKAMPRKAFLNVDVSPSLRRINSEGQIVKKQSFDSTVLRSSGGGTPRRAKRNNGVAKDNEVETGGGKERGDVWLYSGTDDLGSADFDSCLHDYLTSLFWVLESKRLDRSYERDNLPLLSAPFERRDSFSSDVDNRLYRRRCQGRLRKQLGDLCLLAGVPSESTLHYQAAVELLKPAGDVLWIAGSHEGLAVATVVLLQASYFSVSSTGSLQRNVSFSLKRGVKAGGVGGGNVRMLNGAPGGGQTTGLDLADGRNGTIHTSAVIPPLSDEALADYKDAIFNYGKCKEAGILEMEASLKACRVLIRHRMVLEAANFLQNVVYINLQLTDEESIERFTTLASLYAELGMQRKSAFCYRIAAMQCVKPGNPVVSWNHCYHLLLRALPGYRLMLDPKQIPENGPPGWTSIQLRVLHELVYASRRISNPAIAVRHLAYLLHVMFPYLRDNERLDLTSILKTNASKCDGTTSQSIALDDGTILPPVPLTRFPSIRNFKLQPLAPHLRPVRFRRDLENSSNALSDAAIAAANPFIYSPLQLGAATSVVSPWVEGDQCEVSMQLINPLPFELDLVSLALTMEGLQATGCTISTKLPPDSAPTVVKLTVLPQGPGVLNVTGYVTEVMGVRSHCRMRDLQHVDAEECSICVVPELPLLQASTSLSSSETFCTMPGSDCVVSTGAVIIRAGQQMDFTLTLTNIGKLPVDRVDLHLNSMLAQSTVKELVTWKESSVQDQMPVQPGAVASVTFTVTGISDCLTASAADQCLQYEDGMGGWRRSWRETTDSMGVVSTELLLMVQYSGGQGLTDSYCRQCAVSLFVDVLPVVQISKWFVRGVSGAQSCRVMLDVVNVSRYEVELTEQTARRTFRLETGQTSRLDLVVPRCDLHRLQVPYCDITAAGEGPRGRRAILLRHLCSSVKLHWSVPSRSLDGRLRLDALRLSESDCDQLEKSPVSWHLKINGTPVSTDEDGVSIALSCRDMVMVSVSLVSYFANDLVDVVLRLEACQLRTESLSYRSSSVEPSLLGDMSLLSDRLPIDDHVVQIGASRSQVNRLAHGDTVSYTCSFLFPYPSSYRLVCICNAGIPSNPEKPDSTDSRVETAPTVTLRQSKKRSTCQWRHTVVLEMSDIEMEPM